LQPGIQDLVQSAKNQGIPSFLISGGFTILAEPIAEKVGMAGAYANVLEVRRTAGDGYELSGKLEEPIVDGLGKKDYLIRTCQTLGYSPDEVVAVGDGANDLSMIHAARYGVGFVPKPALRDAIALQNQLGDHRLLNFFLFGNLSF
jgi:phosphoserine phosphatase